MDLNRRFANHNKRWNVQINEEEQFVHFKNRVVSVIDESIGEFLVKNFNLDRDFNKKLSFLLGKEPVVKASAPSLPPEILGKRMLSNISMNTFGGGYTEKGFGDTAVYRAIKSTENPQQLLTILQILFLVFEEYDQQIHVQLARKLQDISKLTPSVGFCAVIRKKSVILHPPGAKLLDEGAVNDVIAWLEDYPDAAKYFEEALKIYQAEDTGKYRNLLDNLRFALEQLLKKVLSSNKSIENQKLILLRWLDEKGIHSNLITMYNTLISHYTSYQNSAVKHDEDFSLNEVEFMIYLTGTFMRLLLQVSKQE